MMDISHSEKFLSNSDLVSNKLLYFPALTVVIRCVFKQGDLFYPQVILKLLDITKIKKA